MAVYKRGDVWWYKFRFAGRPIRESAKTGSKTVAKEAEKQRRRELEEGFNNIADRREERVRTVKELACEYLAEYKVRHPRSSVFAEYAIRHIEEKVGQTMAVDMDYRVVKEYQNARLSEQAAPKTINEEVGFLLRLLGERGDAIRIHLRREKTLKLAVRNNVGKAYSKEQKEALLAVAQGKLAKKSIPVCGTDNEKKAKVRSPFILPALTLAFHTGMRDAEIRNLTWNQIDFDKRYLTVDKSKSDAGEGRTIPLNGSLFSALLKHAQWYTNRFGTTTPEWFIFPGRIGKPKKGEPRPYDPSRPVTSLKTAWRTVKKAAEVSGRFHDTRHTLITELCESGAGDQTIMDIAGHVSRQMMARYSHIRMEAKRRALEAIDPVAKNRPAEGTESKESTIPPRLPQ